MKFSHSDLLLNSRCKSIFLIMNELLKLFSKNQAPSIEAICILKESFFTSKAAVQQSKMSSVFRCFCVSQKLKFMFKGLPANQSTY